ncbi:hypothetical protein UPYG_G00156580 [Umbra pygmaea]|uniref:Serine/threonine-protein kinase Sgk1-like n=1 Tax=Umbra pygmaea TaxID=75934 RepID=A0ABD0WYD1_UMBPY
MGVTQPRGRMTHAKMSGLVSFFTAMLKGKKDDFSDFIQKMLSNHQICKHLDRQKILRQESVNEEKAQEETRERELVACHQQGLLKGESQLKPSDFHFVKVIGKGSFGKVVLARYRQSGGFYAVKVLQKETILKKKEQKNVMVERSVLMKGLQHPFLVGLHFSFQTSHHLYFVLDYVSGGDLFFHLQRLGAFSEPRAKLYSAEIASALGYLHSVNIVYRDLKPENILLDRDGHVVLTDFGLCKEGVSVNGTTQTICGTPEYLAPEVLLGKAYSWNVDWWGLGCVLHEMLYGLPPFYSRSRAQMLKNILHTPLRLRSSVSQSAQSLLRGLLEKDSTKRLGERHDLAELQNHSFFLSINWDDLLARKIPPLFIPTLSDPCDVRYFEPAFTRLPVPASLGLSDMPGDTASEDFPGFSYTPPVEFGVTEP